MSDSLGASAPAHDQIPRRRLTKAIAWTAPSAVVAIAAPAYATSHGDTTTPPDIGDEKLGMSGLLGIRKTNCNVFGYGTVDLDAHGSGYGFYVLGATETQQPSNASFTLYAPQSLGKLAFSTASDNGKGWSNLTPDSNVRQYNDYYAYTATFSGNGWSYDKSAERWDIQTRPHWTSNRVSGLCSRTYAFASLRRVTVNGQVLTIQRSTKL